MGVVCVRDADQFAFIAYSNEYIAANHFSPKSVNVEFLDLPVFLHWQFLSYCELQIAAAALLCYIGVFMFTTLFWKVLSLPARACLDAVTVLVEDSGHVERSLLGFGKTPKMSLEIYYEMSLGYVRPNLNCFKWLNE